LTACQKPASAPASYKIGVLVAQTGNLAGLGLQSLDGVNLIADQLTAANGINGRPVEFIVSDDKSDTTEATLAAKKLITVDGVLAIFAGTSTAQTMSLLPVANENKIPVAGISGTSLSDDKLGTWFFRPYGGEDVYITLDLGYLRDQGITKYAAFLENSSYGQGGKVYLPQRSPDFGLTISTTEYFDPGATDLTPQLTNIRNSGAEAIFVWGSSPTAAMAIKQAREMDINLPIVATPSQVTPDMIKSFGTYFEMAPSLVAVTQKIDVWQQLPDSDPDKASCQAFATAFNTKYNHPPATWNILGSQGALFIVDGLKRANITTTDVAAARSQLRDALEKTTNLDLPTGTYTMSATNHFGQIKDKNVLITFKDGKKVLIP